MMGHEEQQVSGALRRIMSVVAVAALMALTVAASAMPAFAQAGPPNCERGQFNAADHSDNFLKHLIKGIECL
jgi:Spy/CpxP family protein refolding chaperone